MLAEIVSRRLDFIAHIFDPAVASTVKRAASFSWRTGCQATNITELGIRLTLHINNSSKSECPDHISLQACVQFGPCEGTVDLAIPPLDWLWSAQKEATQLSHRKLPQVRY